MQVKMSFSQYASLFGKMNFCSPQLLDELEQYPVRDWKQAIEDEEERIHVTDAVSFKAYKEAFQARNKGFSIRQMKDKRLNNENVRATLTDMRRPPNEMQYAVALTALFLSAKHRRQMYVVKDGDGKSRIAATLTLLVLQTDPTVTKVHVVFSNGVLLEKDREILLEPLT